MTQILSIGPAPAEPVAAFDLKPLMVANMVCTMAMMAFISLVGPIARLLQMPAWQAGAPGRWAACCGCCWRGAAVRVQLIRVGALVAACGFGATALSAKAVDAQAQGAAAGSVGAAQGLGIVLGPLAGALRYNAGPGVPYLAVALLLVGVAWWSLRTR